MRIHIGCDMKRDYVHKAKEGTDITVKTESKHEVVLSVREHGIRLIVDGKEQNDMDFKEDSLKGNRRSDSRFKMRTK